MGRAKKEAERYIIDFKMPYRDRELLYREDGTEKYTDLELINFTLNHQNENSKAFAESLKDYYGKNGCLSDNQRWSLYNTAADACPEFDELNGRFFVWYDSRPDMQEMYQACTKQLYWFYDRWGQHHSSDQAREKGWHDRPETWQMFRSVANGNEATKFRELNREVKYDIGDMVQLRKPFVRSWRHDPCYDTDSAVMRVGTVVEHKEQIDYRSRGGLGSRMINVLWLTTGETKAVPERVIKKMPRPK